MSTIGNRIAQRRKALRLSQEALAEFLDTDQRQISRYEVGENDPTGKVLVKLALALNTSTDYLLGLTENPQRPLRDSSDLSEDERQLIALYRQKDPEKKRGMIDVAKVM